MESVSSPMASMDKFNRSVLDDDRIGRLLLKLSIPAFMGMLVMTLYNVVDTIFIGHYVGYLGIAGLSIVFPVQMLSMGVGQMMGMGGASLISRLIGAGNITRAEKALGNAITAIVAASIIIIVAGFINIDFWLRLMGSSETILPYARDYMIINLAGLVFPTLAMSLASMTIAEGNARITMIGMIIGAGLNTILDAIFIIPMGMGIKGAALATVVAQFFSSLYLLRYYFWGNSYLKIRLRNLVLEVKVLKEILAIGVASLARTITTSLSAVFVNRLLVTYGGDMALSAYGIVHRLMMFAIMPGMVVGQGLQPILGFNYGAHRYDRALRVITIAATVSTALGIVGFAALYFAPELFIRIFTADNELVVSGAHASRLVFLGIYLLGPIMVGSLVFQSIGKARQSFITSIGRSVFLIPLVFILAPPLEVDGILLSFPISDALTCLLTILLIIPQLRDFRRQSSRRQPDSKIHVG